MDEKTYRRWFERKLDFIEFNSIGINEAIPETTAKIAAMDCSFVNKSGNKTYGLAKFYDSKLGKAEKGLEISTLAVVDVDFNTAYHVSTQQTSPEPKNEGETRIHDYLRHFQTDCHALPECVRYLATDAYYTKQTFTNGVLEKGFHQVGKLRMDANLRYLYTGEQKPRGRHKQYDGKMVIGDVSRLELAGEIDGIKVYTAVVNSVTLKRSIRIAYLAKKTTGGINFALLFSTDTELNALTLFRYYKSRFQIEFLFRDAKQFTGLTDCQARSKEALHTHFNASFTALNLIKWHDRQQSEKRKPISVASWKARFFNKLLIKHIFCNFDLDLSLIKSTSAYEELCNFGEVAY